MATQVIRLQRIFWPKEIFKNFDTFSIVDPKYQNLKIRVKKDEVWVDSKGNPIGNKDSQMPEEVEIARKIEELKTRKVKVLEPWKLNAILHELGLKLNMGIKQQLNSMGVHYVREKQTYLIER